MNVRLIHGDSLNQKLLLKESIDLTITSPPYNLGKAYTGDQVDDDLDYKDYLAFNKKWLSNTYNWTKSTGRLCLNIGLDKNKNGKKPIYSDLLQIALSVGWKYHTTIVWIENNISRRTAWGSWKSASAPHVIAPVEMIAVLYKDEWKRLNQGKSDITADEFKDWTLGAWHFPGESAKRVQHEAPFPRELPKRCIKLFSFVEDVILDPFAGSGTTMVEGIANNRFVIGIEKELQYCNLINERLSKEYDLANTKDKKEYTYEPNSSKSNF